MNLNSSPVPALAEALRATSLTEHLRWLTADDEPALRELLHARYGSSYSYRLLYEPGGAGRLWCSGALLSLGEFDARGVLLSHSGLWIHPGRDSIDSGLSLTRPSHRSALDRAEHLRLWGILRGVLRVHVGFVHQNTSTLHLMAQRYASRVMEAVPTGLILHYTQGETLVGVEGSGLPMHALAMTTVLSPLPSRARYLPEGPWGEWLLFILAGLGLAGTGVFVSAPSGRGLGDLAPRPLEWNASLRLERRVLGPPDGTSPASASLQSPRARVDLLHLPMAEARLVAEGTALLLSRGYLPTGLRLHQHAPDEIVFQFVEDVGAAREALCRARLAGADARTLFTGWSERCARTS
jgi:hypothetical protein